MKQHVRSLGKVSAGAELYTGSLTADSNRQALQRELMAVHALAGAVSEINPRPPGLSNQAIQFMKRVIRRTLTWYTRPLHQFHAAVARALQEQARVVDHLADQMEQQKDAIDRLSAMEPGPAQPAAENFSNSDVERRLAALENRVHDFLAQREQRGARS